MEEIDDQLSLDIARRLKQDFLKDRHDKISILFEGCWDYEEGIKAGIYTKTLPFPIKTQQDIIFGYIGAKDDKLYFSIVDENQHLYRKYIVPSDIWIEVYKYLQYPTYEDGILIDNIEFPIGYNCHSECELSDY
jgi:hypothetical protein